MHFVDNLWYMGIGMLGIFIVIGVIVVLTMLLNAATAEKPDSEKKD
ncbi:MAG: oxaloacetate decarboxylase [Oscillospiraceae bacterium]|nr:oxaloacetate decarboxylase [Oscillospiraceae bacterium]